MRLSGNEFKIEDNFFIVIELEEEVSGGGW